MKPKEQFYFIGHEAAEARLSTLCQTERLPGSLLITGPKGIGKATLAYRLIRFLLSGGVAPQEISLFGEETKAAFECDPNHPSIQRMLHGSHADVMVIDPAEKEDGGGIAVDDIRAIGGFLRLTSAESGWKIVLIDSADDMNIQAGNALLKMLEEPPAKSLFILISHQPGRLLPTIRSRCQKLTLQPLSSENMHKILGRLIPDPEAEDLAFSVALSEGSPGQALDLYRLESRKLYQSLVAQLVPFPSWDIQALYRLADTVAGEKRAESWQALRLLASAFFSRLVMVSTGIPIVPLPIEGETSVLSRLATLKTPESWLDTWQQSEQTLSEAEFANLDKRASLVTWFSQLQAA